MTDWLEVGKIVGAQGLKGEVRVYPDSDFPERFLQAGQRWLRYPDRPEPQPVQLLRGRYLGGKGLYVVQLDGITDRDHAEALQGCVMLVPASDRPQLEEGEFHVTDLLGLHVIHQPTGATIGVIVNVISAGNDLLVVEPVLVQSAEDGVQSAEDGEWSAESILHTPLPMTQNKGQRTKDKGQEAKKGQKPKDAQEILIPFVKEIVPVVDLEQRRVEITPPAGLIPGY